MKSFSLAAVGALAAVAVGWANAECNAPNTTRYHDRRRDLSKLKIATFNTYFLFSEFTGDQSEIEHADIELHYKNVADQIRNLDADIVALQEVMSCDVLNAVVNGYLSDMDYTYLLTPGMTGDNQQVAFLTRIEPDEELYFTYDKEDRQAYPMANTTCGEPLYYDKTTHMSKHAVMKVTVPYFGSIALLTAHFKASSAAQSCAQREGQGMVAQTISKKFHTARNLSCEGDDATNWIFLGDFNDFDNEIVANQTTGRVLQFLHEGNPCSGGVMKSVASTFENPENATSSAIGLIDHILMSETLMDLIYTSGVDTSIDVGNSSERVPNGYSDHLPVYVVLETTATDITPAPTTEAPTTVAPTTEAPTTEAPTTEAPTTATPTTAAPTTEAPTEDEETGGSSFLIVSTATVAAATGMAGFVAMFL